MEIYASPITLAMAIALALIAMSIGWWMRGQYEKKEQDSRDEFHQNYGDCECPICIR